MLTRSTIKQCAIATLLAVVFVVLLPAAVNATGKLNPGSIPGLAKICTQGTQAGIQLNTDAPAEVESNKPCLFCTSSVPVFADAYAPRVVAMVDGVPVIAGRPPAQDSPPDPAATRPVSPRAPPAAY